MGPFCNFTGLAAPLDVANIDTDQMVPGRFHINPPDYDYGALLFHDLRLGRNRDLGFALCQTRYDKSEILIGGENFGCGSAREQAAYALIQFGIKAVFAPSFGDIFRRNCVNNGLLLGIIDASAAVALCEAIRTHQGEQFSVDLEAQTVTTDDGTAVQFSIDADEKKKLLDGFDEVDRTLARRSEIDVFEANYMAAMGWLNKPLGWSASKHDKDEPTIKSGDSNV
jgi:3-isopropylmalate/(R)-2-methylmalate dehydratase small subunit